MEEPVEPTPDGKLRILVRDHDYGPNRSPGGLWEVHPFSAMRSHGPVRMGWLIHYDDHRTLIPWHEIIEVDTVYNSKKYVDELNEYKELAHLYHIQQGGEDREDCEVCMKIRFMDGPKGPGQILEMPPSTNREFPDRS